MIRHRRAVLKLIASAAVALGFAMPLASASAQAPATAPFEMNFAVFDFPSMTNTIIDVIIAKGFDRANGIVAKPTTYGSAGALWAAVAKGELVAHNMGPYTLPQIRAEGAPIAIYSTLMRLSSEQVVTRDPKIKKFEDLKGKSFAAMVGFPEYDYLRMYARKLGFEFADAVTIVNATPALARTQLEAGRVDGIMVWEPSATMILKANPDARVILTGDQAWTALTGAPGWQGMNIVRLDFAKSHPDMVVKLLNVYQQAGAWLNTHADEADEIISSNRYNSKGVPKGTIADAVKSGRLYYDVKAAWDPETNKRIWQAFELGVEYKAIKEMPPKDAVISSPPK
jgi:ABC-type nitrate/sulfonate/bicarbonate transport system substrate-binding protein